MIGDAIEMYRLISEKWDEYKTIGALFKWDGTRIEGDERIKVHVERIDQNVWIYSVENLNDYAFIRLPVNMSGVIESIEAVEDRLDARAFRYIKVPDGKIYGGTLPNVKVDFMVFGYRPKDLLRIAKGKI